MLFVGPGLFLTGCEGDPAENGADAEDPSNAIAVTAPSAADAGKVMFRTGSDEELKQALQISRDVLSARLQPMGIDPNDLEVKRSFVDDLQMAHTHLQQTLGGVPVFGGEAIVHLSSSGKLFAVTDSLLRNVNVNLEASYTSDEAVDLAVGAYGCESCLTAEPEVDLWVLRQDGRDHLAFRVQLRREDGTDKTSMPVIFIDAHTGTVVWQYENLQTGSGTSLYSGTMAINTYQSGTTYYMEDIPRKLGTFDNRNSTSSTYRFTDTDDVWNSTSQKAGVDAHYGAEMVMDYYKNVHGRNGIDGNGGPGYYTSIDGVTPLITSIVHYGNNYANAFWNGSYMTYGDGDGSTFTPLVSLDIVGHEMTHGVTERTANLTYSGESGALNESMSDVFGAMIERAAQGESSDTWKIGEDCYTPSTAGDALRYMDDPHLAGDYGYTTNDDPDHYSERYTGSSDSGGVHINSGIFNKAFYLLAKGGTHHLGGTMTGIGADQAAAIWYKALTSYMTSSTNFAGARTATLNAASALYGATSTQYTAVGTAWDLVGVAGSGGGGGSGSELVKNGGLEGTYAPFAGTGHSYYTASGSYPHGGTGYAYLGSVNYANGTFYQDITIPSTATSASLSFWLNVTTSEGTSTAYDKLYVEVRNTSGSLLSTLVTYSNKNKSSSSSTYTQRSGFNLLAWKGQTVRVQFRGTTDSSLTTTFRLDDVSVK